MNKPENLRFLITQNQRNHIYLELKVIGQSKAEVEKFTQYLADFIVKGSLPQFMAILFQKMEKRSH